MEKLTKLGDGIDLDLRVDNPEGEALDLGDARIRSLACDGTVLAEQTAPVTRLTTTVVLRPGRSALRLKLRRPVVEPKACAVFIDIGGTGPKRMPVSVYASISLEEPKNLQMDPLTMADDSVEKRAYNRTMKALELLGRDPKNGTVEVTDEEMRTLELKGLLPPER